MEKWEQKLSCASVCPRCDRSLKSEDQRILSVYDHEPICMDCKKKEELQADYEQTSRHTIGSCLAETEVLYGDPGGYCYYHFYPFTCK